MCSMNSEAMQTETLELGSKKISLQGPARRMRWLMLKRFEFSDGFGGRVFIGKIGGDG